METEYPYIPHVEEAINLLRNDNGGPRRLYSEEFYKESKEDLLELNDELYKLTPRQFENLLIGGDNAPRRVEKKMSPRSVATLARITARIF